MCIWVDMPKIYHFSFSNSLNSSSSTLVPAIAGILVILNNLFIYTNLIYLFNPTTVSERKLSPFQTNN